MEQEKVLEIFVQIRKTYNLLGDVLDFSQQMAESLDRDDQTAFQMLLGMRREPIQQLAEAKEHICQMLRELPHPDGEQLRSILNGGPGRDALECRIADQVVSNNRLWEQVCTLDRRLSEKVAHEQSVYSGHE